MKKSSNKKEDPITFKKRQIYQQLKQWDTNRGNTLRFHLTLVTHILRHVDKKTKSSKQYLNYIQSLMIRRLKQIQRYLDKGLTKSQFVLGKNPIKSYQGHHLLIKQLMLHQGQKELQLQHKNKRLRMIFNEYRALRQQNPIDRQQNERNQNSQSINDHTNTQLQGSSILILKYNVRQLIQVQLPEIAQLVHQNSKIVSQVYHHYSTLSLQGKSDLYLQTCKLIDSCSQLIQMHKKIGKQLLGLIKQFIQRQKNMNRKLKQTLVKWLQQQNQTKCQPINEQLLKKDDSALIQDFYSIDDMVTDFDYQQTIQKMTVQQYLSNFTLQIFQLHEQLILCQFQGFYNQKVQLSIIVTIDSFVHLKKYHYNKPEFSFHLVKNIQIKKQGQFGLIISYKKKVYLFKSQTEWEFKIQFNSKQDLQHFQGTVKKISDCQFV